MSHMKHAAAAARKRKQLLARESQSARLADQLRAQLANGLQL